MCALTAVAPIVRFNAFDIFVTPAFFFASDFSSRTSDGVHARRAAFFFLIGIPSSLFLSDGLLSRKALFATRLNCGVQYKIMFNGQVRTGFARPRINGVTKCLMT